VLEYYERARQLICVERSTVQPIDTRWNSDGMARTVESELRVEFEITDGESLPEAHVSREVLRVNGREPRERDRMSRAGCTDPNPISPEPLTFLLPGYRDAYTFSAVRATRHQDRQALIIEFKSANRIGRPRLIEDDQGREDCFDWEGDTPVKGRLWVDASTYDVLKLERHLAGPTDIAVPLPLQRKYGFPAWITIDRDDLTLDYREVTFSDPDEVLVLPHSIIRTLILRSSLQSTRRTQQFTGYQRFLTNSRIKN